MVQKGQFGLYSREISGKGHPYHVDALSVAVNAGSDGQERKNRSFRQGAEHGGHRGGQCHQRDERRQQRVHLGPEPSKRTHDKHLLRERVRHHRHSIVSGDRAKASAARRVNGGMPRGRLRRSATGSGGRSAPRSCTCADNS